MSFWAWTDAISFVLHNDGMGWCYHTTNVCVVFIRLLPSLHWQLLSTTLYNRLRVKLFFTTVWPNLQKSSQTPCGKPGAFILIPLASVLHRGLTLSTKVPRCSSSAATLRQTCATAGCENNKVVLTYLKMLSSLCKVCSIKSLHLKPENLHSWVDRCMLIQVI